MMGERQVQQDALFYGFSLERHVPEKQGSAEFRLPIGKFRSPFERPRHNLMPVPTQEMKSVQEFC
jgi:hypothetical protein